MALTTSRSSAICSTRFEDAVPHQVLRLLAYHPTDIKASVLTIPTDTYKPYHSLAVPATTLGGLDALPTELLETILGYSDLHSVSMVRSVNRRARLVVDASIPYGHIMRHAPRVVIALRRTGAASHFSVDQVFHVLSTPSCHVCGKFGTFMWIPECIRCCFSCLREAPELMPMPEADARCAFGLTKSGLAKVPVMVALPGNYTASGTQYRRRKLLLSREKARQAAIIAHGGEEKLAKYISSSTSQAKIAYDRRVASQAARNEAFDSQGRLNITVDHITRFMSTTLLPYFDPHSRITHHGLACRGCEFALANAPEDLPHEFPALAVKRDRMYTEPEILKHFETCSGAQGLWRKCREEREAQGSSH